MPNDASEEAELYQSSSQNAQLKCAVDLMAKLSIKLGDYVIDIGCGTGDLVKCISEKVGIDGKVIGIDPDSERIEVAKNLCKDHPNVEFRVCKSIDLPVLLKPYDFAISTSALHWVPAEEKVKTFQLVYETLKPGGSFAALYALEKCKGSTEQFHQICEKKIDNYQQMREQAEESSMYFEQPDWVYAQLDSIGFEHVLSRELTVDIDIGSSKAFLDWLVATYSNTAIGSLDIRNVWNIIDGYNINWESFESGGIKLSSKLIEFVVKKPLDA